MTECPVETLDPKNLIQTKTDPFWFFLGLPGPSNFFWATRSQAIYCKGMDLSTCVGRLRSGLAGIGEGCRLDFMYLSKRYLTAIDFPAEIMCSQANVTSLPITEKITWMRATRLPQTDESSRSTRLRGLHHCSPADSTPSSTVAVNGLVTILSPRRLR